MFRSRQRGQGPGLALFLLLMQMMQVGFDRIPPVTLVTIGSQVAIFLRLFNIHWLSIRSVCISAVTVWYQEDWRRLFLAAFFHADDWHLYYNMVSFLFKGLTLEKRFGSVYFAYMIGVFAILCNTLTVGLAILAERVLQDSSYLSQCAVGFSGVLFALKVVTTHLMPSGMQYIMGFFPVPSQYACWAELVVIQLLVPNASFMGHLAGILIGLAYVKGPLKGMMDFFIPSVPSYTYQARSTGYGTSRFWGGSATTAGYNTNNASTDHSSDYSHYTGGLSEDEQMAHAMRQSQTNGERGYPQPSAPPPSDRPPSTSGGNSLYPNLSQQEEMRRRRLARFQ